MIDILDVIIIGAGLAAGTVLNEGKRHYLILEKGNDLAVRNANNPKGVVTGIGGGGLFSDGKISFPPSASNLWSFYSTKSIKTFF